MLKGIEVSLKQKVETGRDPFNAPIFNEQWVTVSNVLIGSPETKDIVDEITLSGKRLAYVLGIPKGDTHNWEDTEVKFFGKTFKTFGMVTQGIEDMIPLSWNKKVKVELFK